MLDRLVDLSLRQRLVVVAAAVAVMIGGAVVFPRLPVDAVPDVSPSLVQVYTVTEGLAPEEVERYVTFPVESQMTSLPRLESIRSTSGFGLSVVNVYFEDGTDIYFARQVVAEALQRAREQIPEGFGDPQMGPIATGLGQVLYYYLRDTTGQYSLTELRTMQDWIVKLNLLTVPGVTEVLGIGGFEKQYQVVVEPGGLLRYDISLDDIVARIEANNENVGAQFIEREGEQITVRSVALAHGIEDLERVVVKTVDGTPVLLRDLARIEIGGAIRRGLQTRNGTEEVVAGMVIKLAGTNSSTVIERVEEQLKVVQDAVPEGVEIVPFYEQKSLVDAAVGTVTSALVQGVLLVLLVLPLFLGGIRQSVVVACAIPFSVLLAVIAMQYLGISANLMSLGGLAIAIGIMVDGAVVLVENVDRRLQEAPEGTVRLPVVREACAEVVRPIVFALLIVGAVFLPLFTLHGVEGKTFRPLAYTIALGIFGSLIYAVLVAPAVSSVLLRARRNGGSSKQGTLLSRSLLSVYEPLVSWLVRRPRAAVAGGIALLAVGILVYPQLGREFTPRLDEGDLMVNLTFAPSASLTEARDSVLQIERQLLEVREVREVITRVGRGEVGAHSAPVNVAHMNVVLAPEDEWRPGFEQVDIERSLRQRLEVFPGVLGNITQPIQLTVDELVGGVNAELAIKIFSAHEHDLTATAETISREIRQMPGAADVQVQQMSGAPQLVIEPDRAALSRFGLNVADVHRVVRAAVGGVTAGQVFDGIRRFDIFVRYAEEARATPEAIGRILIPTPQGSHVELAQVAAIDEIIGPRQILRENGQRYITVQCNVVGRDIGGFVSEAQRRLGESIELPDGSFIRWGGQFELQRAANQRLAVVVPVTFALVAVLLFLSFGRARSVALIVLNLPLALVGGVVALWLSGQNLSVPASVGFIALFGVALENGMVLVSTLERLVRDGETPVHAAIRATSTRLRPVLMTAVTTGLGLIPLLLSSGTGSEVQRPLATVVVGGLVTSAAVTLLILPAVFQWFSRRDE